MATSQPHNLSFHMHVHPYFDTLVVDAATSNHSIFLNQFTAGINQRRFFCLFFFQITLSVIYILSNMNFFWVEKGISKEDRTNTSPSTSTVKEARTKGRADETTPTKQRKKKVVASIVLRMVTRTETSRPDWEILTTLKEKRAEIEKNTPRNIVLVWFAND